MRSNGGERGRGKIRAGRRRPPRSTREREKRSPKEKGRERESFRARRGIDPNVHPVGIKGLRVGLVRISSSETQGQPFPLSPSRLPRCLYSPFPLMRDDGEERERGGGRKSSGKDAPWDTYTKRRGNGEGGRRRGVQLPYLHATERQRGPQSAAHTSRNTFTRPLSTHFGW
jgi:hypothetical protein